MKIVFSSFFLLRHPWRQPCSLPEHGLASLASPINRTGDPDRRADPQDAWIRDEIDDPAVPVR